MVVWYMIVSSDTGGAKSNEKKDALDAKKKMSVLSAIDVPVRVRMFCARILSKGLGDSAMVEDFG